MLAWYCIAFLTSILIQYESQPECDFLPSCGQFWLGVGFRSRRIISVHSIGVKNYTGVNISGLRSMHFHRWSLTVSHLGINIFIIMNGSGIWIEKSAFRRLGLSLIVSY